MKKLLIALLSLLRLLALRLSPGRQVDFSPVQDIAPSAKIIVEKGGRLSLGQKVHLMPRSVLHVLPGGHLTLDEHCYIGIGSMIVCKETVRIENGVSLGPNVLIYDHDHQVEPGKGFLPVDFVSKPVSVGERSWIGANTVLLKGTSIGQRCVVGAGSVLHGEYPPDLKIIQKRQTSVSIL
ncbi:MAG: acyltransferase [Eubacteriales bacterium]|nr:acyltransferase [Eubacteriales bacterium]